MKTIWIIDDEREILDLFQFCFELEEFESFKLIEDWADCYAKPGDIVLHDICGVGTKKEFPGIIYYSHSGSNRDNSEIDFPKPFDLNELVEILIGQLETKDAA